jgi:hypothetical protein
MQQLAAAVGKQQGLVKGLLLLDGWVSAVCRHGFVVGTHP